MKPIVGSRCMNISFFKLFICHFCYKPYFHIISTHIFSIFIWFQTTIYTFIQLIRNPLSFNLYYSMYIKMSFPTNWKNVSVHVKHKWFSISVLQKDEYFYEYLFRWHCNRNWLNGLYQRNWQITMSSPTLSMPSLYGFLYA